MRPPWLRLITKEEGGKGIEQPLLRVTEDSALLLCVLGDDKEEEGEEEKRLYGAHK